MTETKTHKLTGLRSVISFVRCAPEDLNAAVSGLTGIPDSCTTVMTGRSGAVFSRDCSDGGRMHFFAVFPPADDLPVPRLHALLAHLCVHSACDILESRSIPCGVERGGEALAHAVQEIMEACLEWFDEQKRGTGDDEPGERVQALPDWWPCFIEEKGDGEDGSKR